MRTDTPPAAPFLRHVRWFAVWRWRPWKLWALVALLVVGYLPAIELVIHILSRNRRLNNYEVWVAFEYIAYPEIVLFQVSESYRSVCIAVARLVETIVGTDIYGNPTE